MTEQDLVLRLRQVEADLAPSPMADPGEAGPDARQRIIVRRESIEVIDPPMEHHFRLEDPAQRRLLTGLLRRYDLTPYRYPRQTDVDVMVRMSLSFEAELFHPVYQAMKEEWAAWQLSVMGRVAVEALHWDISGAGESVVDVPRTIGRK